ncbi:hypothetical protein E4634_02185 [Mangrovimicrobium sediminis]|uniref:Uncharacterized protein n=1 Tax=Mangrovimicrobium sediminis TaxID=2562682 RepID=A0A4Z0M859_9GAMM|nr:hypothetical protein [Haliea sp. SAOS-164]TGD75711.1 hypothetical protein E4634_02185 [Haliea sp. SAOS-164]
MIGTTSISVTGMKRHWFWPAAFAVAAINAFTIVIDGWQAPQLKEFGVIFDFAVLIPLLYFFCYRKLGKQTLVRTIAFACLGFWVAGKIVPDTHHLLIDQLAWVRYLGLAVLVLIEIRIATEIWRLAFCSRSEDASEAIKLKAEQEGMPPWVAKLMAAEAKFWKKLLQAVRSIFDCSR